MDLLQLSKVPEEGRDQSWENQFLQAFASSALKLISENPVQGPDGWPYLMAEVSDGATEPAQKVLAWLATRGMGLVVNPTKDYPDYVFSYGMIWSFRETGFFFQENVKNPEVGPAELNAAQIAHAGTPTEQYLPQYVRQILRDFFRDQGVFAPKILMISQDRVHYDLAFSLESLKNPPEAELAGIAEAIGWFLPPHYSLLLISDEGLPHFCDL